MTNLLSRAQQGLQLLWQADRLLTATGLAMLPLLAIFLVGLIVDSRVVTGAPVWLKPAKFAASIAIYTLTLAWAFSYLRDWRRVRAVAGWTTAIVLIVEMAIIAAQAARGTTSHFNFSTPLDGALFAIMGAAIVLQTLMSVSAAIALWRARFDDAAMGWALRFGLTIAILGASTGGLMVQPTEAQLAALRASTPVTVVGAHTVGAVDGGPGLPGTGWSISSTATFALRISSACTRSRRCRSLRSCCGGATGMRSPERARRWSRPSVTPRSSPSCCGRRCVANRSSALMRRRSKRSASGPLSPWLR